jgi:hypothetical protein
MWYYYQKKTPPYPTTTHGLITISGNYNNLGCCNVNFHHKHLSGKLFNNHMTYIAVIVEKKANYMNYLQAADILGVIGLDDIFFFTFPMFSGHGIAWAFLQIITVVFLIQATRCISTD